jgi:hypothetical protein
VAEVQVSYVHRDATRLAVRVNHDVMFSYDPTQPYYLFTGVDVAVTRFVTDRLRVSGSLGRQDLDYRQNFTDPGAPRRDTGLLWALSVMYETSRDVSFGVTADYQERSSSSVPDYDGLRTGVIISYGR